MLDKKLKADTGIETALTVFIAGFVTLIFYVLIILWMDNTNLATTNGLWKSSPIKSWALYSKGWVDMGGPLYTPVYGVLSRLISSSWLQYGTPAESVIYRKIAMLNAFFGACATALVCYLACIFDIPKRIAFLMALLHAFFGFVLLNSINSEDVIPAYFLFLGALVSYFLFLKRAKAHLLLLICFFSASIPFFHWTLLPPFCFSILVVSYYLFRNGALSIRKILLASIGFFLSIVLILMVARFCIGKTELGASFLGVLFSPKHEAGGWVGFSSNKFFFSLCGISNYLLGAKNITVHQWSNYLTPHLLASSAFVIYGLIFSIQFLMRSQDLLLKALTLLGLTLFLSGEAMQSYAQPQDPQSQIQPMFFLVTFLIAWIKSKKDFIKHHSKGVIFFAVAGILFLATFNVSGYSKERGQDSRNVLDVKKFESIFADKNARFYSYGFDNWVTWAQVIRYQGNTEALLKHFLFATTYFTQVQYASAEEAANQAIEQINRWQEEGMTVFASVIWVGAGLEGLAQGLTTVASVPVANRYVEIMSKKFKAGGEVKSTPYGDFIEIIPVRASSENH